MEGFESMNKSTELDTLVNRQPMKLLKKRGRVSVSVLNSLEAGDVLLGSVVTEAAVAIRTSFKYGF